MAHPPERTLGRLAAAQGIDFIDFADHFKEAGRLGTPRFLGRRYSKADGPIRATLIGNDKARIKGIKAPVHTLYGGIKGFEIDADIIAQFHDCLLYKHLFAIYYSTLH